MRTYTTTFDRVEMRFSKAGKCTACGKQATRSTTIWNSINPFNKDPSTGEPRSREQVRECVSAEGKAWKDAPIYHKACEP